MSNMSSLHIESRRVLLKLTPIAGSTLADSRSRPAHAPAGRHVTSFSLPGVQSQRGVARRAVGDGRNVVTHLRHTDVVEKGVSENSGPL